MTAHAIPKAGKCSVFTNGVELRQWLLRKKPMISRLEGENVHPPLVPNYLPKTLKTPLPSLDKSAFLHLIVLALEPDRGQESQRPMKTEEGGADGLCRLKGTTLCPAT